MILCKIEKKQKTTALFAVVPTIFKLNIILFIFAGCLKKHPTPEL